MDEALKEAVRLISEWRPLPPKVARGLSPETLKLLLKVVSRLRAAGYADKRYRAPLRLRAIKRILESMDGGRPTAGELPPETAAGLSLGIRQTDALKMEEDLRRIARARLSGHGKA